MLGVDLGSGLLVPALARRCRGLSVRRAAYPEAWRLRPAGLVPICSARRGFGGDISTSHAALPTLVAVCGVYQRFRPGRLAGDSFLARRLAPVCYLTLFHFLFALLLFGPMLWGRIATVGVRTLLLVAEPVELIPYTCLPVDLGCSAEHPCARTQGARGRTPLLYNCTFARRVSRRMPL